MNVVFNDKAYEVLSKLEKNSGKSKSEVLRNAIALLEYIEDAKSRDEGVGVAIIKNNKITKEIIIP